MLNCPKHEEAACNVQPKFIHHQLVITSSCAKIVLLFKIVFSYYFIIISVFIPSPCFSAKLLLD